MVKEERSLIHAHDRNLTFFTYKYHARIRRVFIVVSWEKYVNGIGRIYMNFMYTRRKLRTASEKKTTTTTSTIDYIEYQNRFVCNLLFFAKFN